MKPRDAAPKTLLELAGAPVRPHRLAESGVNHLRLALAEQKTAIMAWVAGMLVTQTGISIALVSAIVG